MPLPTGPIGPVPTAHLMNKRDPRIMLVPGQEGEGFLGDIWDGAKKVGSAIKSGVDTVNGWHRSADRYIGNQIQHNRLISKAAGAASAIPSPYSTALKGVATAAGLVGLGQEGGGCGCGGEQHGSGAGVSSYSMALARSSAVKW